MRLLKLTGTILALILIASACGGDDEEAGDEDPDTTATTLVRPVETLDVPEGTVTTPTAPLGLLPDPATPLEPGLDNPFIDDVPDPADTIPTTGVAPPVPPSNVACLAGTRDGELLVEWDALSTSEVSKIRVYVSESGGPFITNGEYTIDQVETTRSGGARWAAPARRLPANVPLRLTATSFNLLGQESGWYIINGVYTGPGQPCGDFPATTCTAGCEEAQDEPEEEVEDELEDETTSETPGDENVAGNEDTPSTPDEDASGDTGTELRP